jgi:hypothetical protein
MAEPVAAAVGLYTDREAFLRAVRTAMADGLTVDATTPYPVHGLDDALGLQRSFIGRPVLGVVLLGCAVVLGALIANSTVVWPVQVSGKPYDAWPFFVVCTLEAGLLAGALVNFVLALHTSRLLPNPLTAPISARLSDDACAVILPASDTDLPARTAWLQAHGAADITTVRLVAGTAEVAHA